MITIYDIVLVLPAFLFAIYAQYKVKSTFNYYSQQGNARGLTGAEVARIILDENGLTDIPVEAVEGKLSDHYDPSNRILRLSDSVYGSTSVAALGVAAHEAGHALQHKTGYFAMGLRGALVPVANIGSTLGPWMALGGFFFHIPVLIHLGIILFSCAVAFYLITLPVEFNASNRALSLLESCNILEKDELNPARKVLNAAAMTYVASAAVAMAHLLSLILSLTGRRGEE
jgi:Zn-dependent membrane protease YugP